MGELQKRIRFHQEPNPKPHDERSGLPDIIEVDVLEKVVEEMKKEIEQYLGGKHYSANYKRFIHGINDDERLVLCLEKWLGER